MAAASPERQNENVHNPVVNALRKKVRQAKDEYEAAKDKAMQVQFNLEAETKKRDKLETEQVNLTRRIGLLEDDLERATEQLKAVSTRLEDVEKTQDESHRAVRGLQGRVSTGDERAVQLEDKIRTAQVLLQETEPKYQEIARKLALKEAELDATEERAESAERKRANLDAELRAARSSLRQHENKRAGATESEQTQGQKIKAQQEAIAKLDSEISKLGLSLQMAKCCSLRADVKQSDMAQKLEDIMNGIQKAEQRADVAEKQEQVLQKKVDNLEDDLIQSRDRVRDLQDEMERTIADIANY